MAMLLVLVVFWVFTLGASVVPQQEILALKDIYDHTDAGSWFWGPADRGPRWFQSNSTSGGGAVVTEDTNPCSDGGMAWQGVRCSGTPAQCDSQLCSVIYLQLPNFNINGRFFHPSIGNLTNLQVLNMFSNPALSGSLPENIAAASLLFYMDFTGCAVSGSLPPSLGDLTDMWQLKFRDNSLVGSLPISLTRQTGLAVLELRGNLLQGTLPLAYSSMETLRVFDLKFNSLTGTLPPEYCNMMALTNFEVYRNDLTGTIPSSFGELTNLQVLDFDFNFFHGTIPAELGNLLDMRRLYFYGNLFTGSVPASIGNLTRLSELDLGGSDLGGTIPSELGQLVHLVTLYLDDNIHVTGPIPSELGNLMSIEVFWMHDNHLSSSLPATLGNLTTVQSMTFFRNFLTGSIPTTFSQLSAVSLLLLHANQFTGNPFPAVTPLTSLMTLWLDSNIFTGSLDDQLGSLQRLTHLRLQNNLFSQEITSSLGYCSNLQLLELENNQFTATIPSTLGNLTVLEVLKLASNHFTGTVPYLGNLSAIEDLVLRDNAFIGGLSFGLEHFEHLEFLDISANQFSGQLVPEVGLGSLLAVTQMYIQGNLFSGSLEDIFPQPENMSVVYLDASDNRFSGSVPGSLFQMPYVGVIALSLNCFQGSLPQEMCAATEVQVLSMDGLGANTDCPDSLILPFTQIALFNKLEGSIPACVFSMPSLEFLHLTGNGLTGTLADLPNTSHIDYLHLAHNQLTSTIPLSFQRNHFTELDLSYNKITGEYKYPLVPENSTSGIIIHINRLSGSLDVHALESASELNILRDNIFDCQHLPHNDPHYNIYSCESTTLNDAYFLLTVISMLVVSFVIAIAAVRVHAAHQSVKKGSKTTSGDDEESQGNQIPTNGNHSSNSCPATQQREQQNIAIDFHEKSHLRQVYVLMKNFRFYLQFLDRSMEATDESLRHIQTYSRELKTFSIYLLILSAICVISVIPVLLLKSMDQNSSADNKYVTHAHVYGWKYSMAFVTGELPAALLLGAWVVSCSAFICFVIQTLRTNSSHLLHRQRSRSSLVHETIRRMSQRKSGFWSKDRKENVINAAESFWPRNFSRESDFFAMERLNRDSTTSSTSSSDEQVTSAPTSPSSGRLSRKNEKMATKIRRHVIISSVGLMMFNTVVVSVVNGLYINYSPQVSPSTAVMFQFALAMFNVIYSIFVIPALTVGFIRHSDAINVRIWLLLVNSLVIPCIVTAVTSPSCIQGIFVKPDAVTASYSYTPDCSITQYSHTGEPICTDTSDIFVEVAALIPPFTYNYQCTSVLLTAYIPVFIYTYSLQVIAPFIFLFLLCFIKYTTLPRPFRKTVPGILFPNNWSKDRTEQGFRSDVLQIAVSKRLYNIKTVTSNLIHNIIILLTFGLCSPVLACLIGAASYLITATWRILIARFVHYRIFELTSSGTKKHRQDYALASMGALAGEAKGLILLCLWPYVFVSAFFFLCLTWDMSGDRVGWRKGSWAPLASVCVLSVMYTSVNLYSWYTSPISGDENLGIGGIGARGSQHTCGNGSVVTDRSGGVSKPAANPSSFLTHSNSSDSNSSDELKEREREVEMATVDHYVQNPMLQAASTGPNECN